MVLWKDVEIYWLELTNRFSEMQWNILYEKDVIFFWQLNARFCVVTVELVLGRINVAAHQDMEEHSVKKVHCKL